MTTDRRKLLILALLLLPCVWLVRRNFFAPGTNAAASARFPSQNASSAKENALAASQPGAAVKATARTRRQIVDVDPTIRLDLLEASRNVKYSGSARSIFEIKAPPPPPPPPTPVKPPADSIAIQPPPPPKPPVSTLKFYGTTQEPGSPKRAFLTDGEEIMIAKEGEVVAKFFRVNRIGVTSLEIEDTRSKEKQQLPLLDN